MTKLVKTQKDILAKLKIEQLNPMQLAAAQNIHSNKDVVILSPTGTGKTLAFLLPMVQLVAENCDEVQALILVPSRELAIQIEQVIREMGSGFKTNAVYGGRLIKKDKEELKHRPAILVGTPGRVAAHLRKDTFPTNDIKVLVLDEFDKSLQTGFENEMKEIIACLSDKRKNILTSASQNLEIPRFVGLAKPVYLDYLKDGIAQLKIKTVISPIKDKLETLVELLCHLGNQPGIVFCNFKDSIERVSDFLHSKHIQHGCFYGGLEQRDRERSLIKFRNGTHHIIIATDLAARGIDIPELKFIIHFHLPTRDHEFTHRNGRTARMNKDGTAFVIKWKDEKLPSFIKPDGVEKVKAAKFPPPSIWTTLFISGGRKDKISKGDIAGMFFKQGDLKKEELGIIELKHDCAFVSVHQSKARQLVKKLDNVRLKNKKVRINRI